MRTRSTFGLLLALVAAPVLAQTPDQTPARTQPQAPSLEERLDRLVERLEEARQKFHNPGMAIAVVKNDEVILSRGFGLADTEQEIPATDETIFAVGSTTKAFTAALVGMLVDDG